MAGVGRGVSRTGVAEASSYPPHSSPSLRNEGLEKVVLPPPPPPLPLLPLGPPRVPLS